MITRFSKITFILLLIPLLNLTGTSDVKSTTGTVKFYPNLHQDANMSLTSSGLSLGTATTAQSNLHVQGNAIVQNELTLGTGSQHSQLNINGSLSMTPAIVQSDTVIAEGQLSSMTLVNSASGNITLTLPYAGNCTGQLINVKQISSSNEVILKALGSQTFSLATISQGGAIKLVSYQEAWQILSTMNTVSSNNDGHGSYFSTNLILHYPFDGHAQDLVAQQNLTATANAPTYSTGVSGNAAKFNKDNSTVFYKDFTPSFTAPSALTLHFWVKLPSNTWSCFVDLSQANNDLSFVRIGNGGNDGANGGYSVWQEAEGPGAGTFTFSETYKLKTPTWHLFSVTLEDTKTKKYYFDGQLIYTSTLVYSKPADAFTGIVVGGRYSNGRALNSYATVEIDDLRVYDRAFTAAEIQKYYQRF